MAAVSLGGELYFASHEGVDAAGVAAWYPPGRMFFDTWVFTSMILHGERLGLLKLEWQRRPIPSGVPGFDGE